MQKAAKPSRSMQQESAWHRQCSALVFGFEFLAIQVD